MNPADPAAAKEELRQGLVAHRAGETRRARLHYQQATELAPVDAGAWYLLGACDLEIGDVAAAVHALQESIRLRPAFADAHLQLGIALLRTQRLAESSAAFLQAMRLREKFAEAAYWLGLAHESGGNFDAAERAYAQILEWNDSHGAAANRMAHLLRRQRRLIEALEYFSTAQRVLPQDPQTNGNLAMILLDLHRYKEAATYAQLASTIEPGRAQWWVALGVAARAQKDVDAAIAALGRAVELDPDGTYAKAELALVLVEAGDVDGSRRMLAALRPGDHAERFRWVFEFSLPSIYRDQSEIEIERQRFERGLDTVNAGLTLDTPKLLQGALEAASSVSITQLHYQDRNNTGLQCRFGDLITRVMSGVAPDYMQACAWPPCHHGGRLRVGIVSSHLMHHSISRYYTTLITSLDRERFDVRVWYLGAVRDFNTELIAGKVDKFTHVSEDLITTAGAIRSSQLDVLVYVETGTDPRHQALAAMRLAPIQCVLAGHPVSSGIPNVDFYLSGDALEPAGAQQHYRERLVRLPGIGACPKPPPPAGDGSWLDSYDSVRPMLLCLQNHLKLLPAFDLTLAKIARQTGARIGFFIRKAMVGRLYRARLEQCFTEHKLDPGEHLVFLPGKAHENYLAAIARSPLVIDSPWFSGGATSLDAFSVGTPVLAWEGPMARGRQTAGMLRLMEIEDLIARSEDEYVNKVATLLADRAELATLRERIDERKSRLFEDRPTIRAFENFLVDACAGRVA